MPLLMDDDIAMSKRQTGLRRYWKWLAAAAVIAFVAGISLISRKIIGDDPTPHLQFRSLLRADRSANQNGAFRRYGRMAQLGSELEICERAEGELPVKLCGEAFIWMSRATSTVLYRGNIAHGGPGFGLHSTSMPTMKNSLSSGPGALVDVTALGTGRAAAFDPRRCSPTTPAPGSGRYAWWIPIILFPGPKASSSSKSAPLNRYFMQLQHFTEFGSIAIRT